MYFFSFPPFIKSSMSYISSCFTRIFWVNRPIPKYKRCIILMTHQKIFFFVFFSLIDYQRLRLARMKKRPSQFHKIQKNLMFEKKKRKIILPSLQKKKHFFQPAYNNPTKNILHFQSQIFLTTQIGALIVCCNQPTTTTKSQCCKKDTK